MKTTVYERKTYKKEKDKLQIQIKRILIGKCKLIFTFRRLNIVSEGGNLPSISNKNYFDFEQKYSPFHALCRQLVSFYKRIKVYHIGHDSRSTICFLTVMFVFMVVPGITACNINPYRIYGVIFKKTKFNETDYWSLLDY